MKNLLILLLTLSFSNAANLLTHNIYERSDRVDIMLSFDSPYEGKISQKRGQNITTLTLTDLTYDKLIEKNINSKILQAIAVEPNKGNINIVLKSSSPIAVIASKTVDGFGLRIRTKPLSMPMKNAQTLGTPTQSNQPEATFSTKSSEDLLDGRYVSVIIILAILLLFMFWIKRKVVQKQNTAKEKSTWLFKGNDKNLSNKEVNVLHKKQIDNTNSVVLLEFENKKYLVMTGSSNLLLEKFSHEDIKDNLAFEEAFEDNRKKLDDYLKLQQDDKTDNYRSKLEKY